METDERFSHMACFAINTDCLNISQITKILRYNIWQESNQGKKCHGNHWWIKRGNKHVFGYSFQDSGDLFIYLRDIVVINMSTVDWAYNPERKRYINGEFDENEWRDGIEQSRKYQEEWDEAFDKIKENTGRKQNED